jgi:hypothetical protein
MKHDQNKKTYPAQTAPLPDGAKAQAAMDRVWKPEVSSLKREDWRRIVMERLG